MPRKLTGQVRYNGAKGCYETRLRYRDKRRVWVALPKGLTRLQAEAKSRAWAKQAKNTDSPTPKIRPAGPGGETVTEHFVRHCEERRKAGLVTVYDDERRYYAHVAPIIGDMPIAYVNEDQIEDVRDSLNAKARAGYYVTEDKKRRSFGAKSAQNVWVMMQAHFKAASRKGEVRALRIRNDNPVANVAGTSAPTRKAKQFLYPSELLRLVSEPTIPMHWRRGYAISVYAFLRSGELEALTFGDIDLEHHDISVNKALQSNGTIGPPKNGEARTVPIEPALLPLLTVMRAEAIETVARELGPTAKRRDVEARVRTLPVVPMPQRNNRPIVLREDMEKAGITRPDLFARDATRTPMTYHDLRATGITWAAVRGEAPFKLHAFAGHKSVSTTEKYIRRAATLGRSIGEVFPQLPVSLLHHRMGTIAGKSSRAGGDDE
jgi:integrase